MGEIFHLIFSSHIFLPAAPSPKGGKGYKKREKASKVQSDPPSLPSNRGELPKSGAVKKSRRRRRLRLAWRGDGANTCEASCMLGNLCIPQRGKILRGRGGNF